MNFLIFKYEYLSILIFALVSSVVAVALVTISYLLAPQKADYQKLSSYECGFEPFDDSRGAFDVHFYIVAILFIIFDLEIAVLFPWAIHLYHLGSLGFWSAISFLLILYIGFVYEWQKGALDW